jgi:hypothetical protein
VGLFLLTAGDVSGSVPLSRLRVEAVDSQPHVDDLVGGLVDLGLAKTFLVHAEDRVSITPAGVKVMSGLTG